MIALLFYVVKCAIQEENAKDKIIQFIFILAFVGYLIISFFDFPKQRIEHIIFFNTILSILYFRIMLSKKKNYFNLNSHFINLGVIVLLLGCSTVSIARFKGEMFASKMYKARIQRDWSKIIECCDKSESYFYCIDPGGMPIRWYRGTANSSLKDFQSTYSDFLTAYKYTPFDKNVISDLGSINYILGNKQKAIEYYIQAAFLYEKAIEKATSLNAH